MNPTAIRKNQIQPGVKYKGQVLDNNDPDKRGRVRVKVFGVLDNLDSEDHYPWAVPDWSHGDGSTQYSGKFDVPKVNAIVGVEFQVAPDGSGSIYHPRYTSSHTFEPETLKDSEHHYPNRKVHRLSNGAVVIVDTEDDSVWMYNPGESHIKSAGKLCIKSEETFVLISDVEVGIRAPEVAVRALEHLILESENKLTIRSAGPMNIETRDNLQVLARLNIDVIADREQIRVTARGNGSNGDIRVRSLQDSVLIEASGNGGRQANVDIKALKNNVTVLGQENVTVTAATKDVAVTGSQKVGITAQQQNVEIKALQKNVELTSVLKDVNITAASTGTVTVQSLEGKVDVKASGLGVINLTATTLLVLEAPAIEIITA